MRPHMVYCECRMIYLEGQSQYHWVEKEFLCVKAGTKISSEWQKRLWVRMTTNHYWIATHLLNSLVQNYSNDQVC